MKPVKIIAHRGNSSQAPENTRAAFLQAIEMGVDFIECDLQLSQDDIPVVIHDGCFTRITQNQLIHEVNRLSFKELGSIDIGSWFHPDFAQERCMTLENFLHLPKERTGMMIEVKEETFTACHLSLIVGRAIKAYHHEVLGAPPIIVGSLSPEVLYCFEGYLPEQQLIPIMYKKEQLKEFAGLQAQHYAIHHSLAEPAFIEQLHKQGAEVWSWTVDDLHIAKEVIQHGVDGIITNTPQKMIKFREERFHSSRFL